MAQIKTISETFNCVESHDVVLSRIIIAIKHDSKFIQVTQKNYCERIDGEMHESDEQTTVFIKHIVSIR